MATWPGHTSISPSVRCACPNVGRTRGSRIGSHEAILAAMVHAAAFSSAAMTTCVFPSATRFVGRVSAIDMDRRSMAVRSALLPSEQVLKRHDS
jgi:hypothetical protein